MAVQRGGRGRGCPGNIEQDGREATSEHTAHVKPEEQCDRDVWIEYESEGQQYDDSRGNCHTRDHADNDAE